MLEKKRELWKEIGWRWFVGEELQFEGDLLFTGVGALSAK